MGKGYNNDHYTGIATSGYCEVVSNPSGYHTSRPVTTKPVNYHRAGIATSGYCEVVSNPSGYHTSRPVTTKPVNYHRTGIATSGYCEVVSKPSGYHTSQPVKTKPVNYHRTGIATTGYASYQPTTEVRRVENGPKIKPVITYSSKTNQVQSKPLVIHSSKPNQVQSYETTSRIKHVDKQTGNYQRITTKDKVSNSQVHVERGSGKIGVKNEIKKTSTVRIGNSSGYTEVYTEQRVRRVDFGNSGSNKRLTHGGY